ncbi:MAG: YafY family transcriptional regulator [bacterium]|nr:YafY family transcriptional regulator [bacterium]
MRRADRLFQLIQTLRARRFATGQELAEALGVSKRTLYRDVQDLQRSGVPIRGEAGVGYRLDRGFELPPLTFTTEELEGLALGARIVAAWGDAELGKAVASAVSKIEAVIPPRLREALLHAPLFAPGFSGAAARAQHLDLLRRAIGETEIVQLQYTREDGERSLRDVRPLGLYFWGSKWTLAAWCELRQDYRSFRPDRMQTVDRTGRRFDPTNGPSLKEYLAKTEAAGQEWGAPPPRGIRTPGLDR